MHTISFQLIPNCTMYYVYCGLDDQRPKLQDLPRFLTDHCKHWRGTGLQLGLKFSVLDQVEHDYHTLSERFRIVLEKWLQLNVGVTWGNLELAITNANRESLGLQPLTTGKEKVYSSYVANLAGIFGYYCIDTTTMQDARLIALCQVSSCTHKTIFYTIKERLFNKL